jgi:hypothetical protein
MRWLPFLIGWLVGSFFGLPQLLGLFKGLTARKS